MNFSEIFKAQRKANGYTQERIAEILNVTAQAVSRWETGAGMPDVSLIVPIARLFQITTDELLGNNYKDAETIRDELHTANASTDDPFIKYRKYHDMLRMYPRSADVYMRLMNGILEILIKKKNELSDIQRDEYVSEAERYSEKLREIEDEYNGALVYSHAFLAEVYLSVDEYEKAENEINCLPYCRYGKARMMGNLRVKEQRWEDALEQYRESISDALRWLFFDIERSALCSWKATDDNTLSIKLFKLVYDMIHLLYKDSMFPLPLNYALICANRQLAAHMARLGEDEKVFEHINEMITLAEEYEKQFGENFDTGCILYPKAMPPYDTNKVKKSSYKKIILHALNDWNSFDTVRNTKEFKELLHRAEQLG